MSRDSQQGQAGRQIREDIAFLQQFGGPFIVRIQRRQVDGRIEWLGMWHGVTFEELADDIEQRLFSYAGGGRYNLLIYTPDNKSKPRQTLQVNIPGAEKVPVNFQENVALGMDGAAGYTGSTWPNAAGMFPGMGVGGVGMNPLLMQPFGNLAARPGMSPWTSWIPPYMQTQPTQEDPLRAMAQWQMFADTSRYARTEEREEMDRRDRTRRREERLDAMMEQMGLVERLGIGGAKSGTGPSPEVESLKTALKGLEDRLAQQAAESRADRERVEAEARRRESDERHARDMEALRREREEDRRRAEEAQRVSDDRFAKIIEEVRRGQDDKSRDETRREEERRREEARVAEQRRVDDLAREDRRLREEQLREDRRLEQERIRAEAASRDSQGERMTTLLLKAHEPRDDSSKVLAALGGIFGQTLQGQQTASQSMFTALQAALDSSRKAGELPEWIAKLLTDRTSKGEEMAQMAQATGNIMSVALGTVGQAISQMAQFSQGNPWLSLADSALQEIGAIGSALLGGGREKDEEGETLPSGPTPQRIGGGRTSQRGEIVDIPVETTTTDKAKEAAERVRPMRDTETKKATAVPESAASVVDAEAVSPAAIAATRIRQIRGAIETGLPPDGAARSLVEMAQIEHAYSGMVPAPLDKLFDDPEGVVTTLFGAWLAAKGPKGRRYLAAMATWAARFAKQIKAGEDDDDEEGDEGDEGDEGEDEEAVAAANGADDGIVVDDEEGEEEEEEDASPVPGKTSPKVVLLRSKKPMDDSPPASNGQGDHVSEPEPGPEPSPPAAPV